MPAPTHHGEGLTRTESPSQDVAKGGDILEPNQPNMELAVFVMVE